MTKADSWSYDYEVIHYFGKKAVLSFSLRIGQVVFCVAVGHQRQVKLTNNIMASCGKKSTVSLQKLPSSISSDENILRFEEEFSLGKIPYKAQKTWKETHLAFCFHSSSANMYLAWVFSANYLFYMEAIYFETTEFERRGVREGPKAAVPFGLISVQGIAAGWAMRGFPACHCFNLFSLVSQAQNTWYKAHVQDCKYWRTSFVDLLQMPLPYDLG